MVNGRITISTLQKAYDDSYLTCSTAVYYESQGNEPEALRCWRVALDQIRDRHANEVPPNYAPKSETERTLADSLRELELQCKERIDLLEALRLSRQDECSSRAKAVTTPASDAEGREAGWIGEGTIPAITYPELSRPARAERPPLPSRTSSGRAAVGESSGDSNLGRPPSHQHSTPSHPKSTPDDRPSRSPSPERRHMRTTLRANKLADKDLKSSSRRLSSRPSDGPGANKAATLAWSATGVRDRVAKQTISTSAIKSPNPVEGPRGNPTTPPAQWDSHSRRLVTSRTGRIDSPAEDRPVTIARHSDEYPFPRPSSFSISAASSALGSMSLNQSAGRASSESDRAQRQRTALSPVEPSELRESGSSVSRALGDNRSDVAEERQSASGFSIRRKPIGRASAAGGRHAAAPGTPQGTNSRSYAGRREKPRQTSTSSADGETSDSRVESQRQKRNEDKRASPLPTNPRSPSSNDSSDPEVEDRITKAWAKRKAEALKNLPSGVDGHAAKQILNEIIVRGDEVHWSDVAGLEAAKSALREAVVYPFLRPDLFMGLREPARGMLLFGPPGTGKTMLARAVATESKSTFFSISASSLTSKYLGESEKLVRALFSLARILAPSIIFVDEIDSLLSQRSGSGEHEATRRIKTEFLIQWGSLQRAAAGREASDKDKERGDPNRVLVLAATNLPWAIDEAARRRFVRRQYIPLPEAETRAIQLRTLLAQQKHGLSDTDIEKLVDLTDGFSGSDITALAKDAAMGPLRSLGEALLHMSMDEIRPIDFSDFDASLITIRPSVSKAGLKEYEDWAKQFGERGG